MNREILQTKLNSQVENRTTTVTFSEVWSKYENNQVKHKRIKKPYLGLVACLILLIATPVGASVYNKWHNLEYRPVLPEVNVTFAEFESYPWLVESHKNFNLEESQKLASFKILRPAYELEMPLEVSRGTIQYPPSLPMKNFKGPITYFDLWHKGDKWVYAIQRLDEDTKKLLNGKAMKVTFKIPSNDKVIPIKDKDGIAIIRDLGEQGKWIRLYVKNQEEQVVRIELRGNISEKELIKLAQSYAE